MEKEGGQVNRPPILDGSNYDYWKVRMTTFLKSIVNKTWKSVVKGSDHPRVKDKDGNDTIELKPVEEWSKDADDLALGNNKALNALFNGVDKNMFRLINNCTVAKDAWNILRTKHEGTSKVKMSKLQLITIKFETLKMKDDESIQDFHMSILELANASGSLGEKMIEEKLVGKILRSLPKRFDMKVTAIEEAQHIANMKVEELIRSLQTFEMAIDDHPEKKNKGIAFLYIAFNDQTEGDLVIDEEIFETVVLLGRQFNNILKRLDKGRKPNVKNISSNIKKYNDSWGKTKVDNIKTSRSKEIKINPSSTL